MINENLKEVLNLTEEKIEELVGSMEIASSFITKTSVDILKIKKQLELVETEIRLNTDFKAVGCNNKEERESYILTVPEYRELYLQKRDLEVDLLEYKHRYSTDERELEMYYKFYFRMMVLEEYDLKKELKGGE